MTYRVDTAALELGRGSFFTVLPGVSVEAGQMGFFDLGGFLIVGRWDPGPDGESYVLIPGYRIRISGAIALKIVGRVLPLEAEFKQFPPAEEFPRTLVC